MTQRIDQLETSAVARIQLRAVETGWDDTISMAGGEPTFQPPEAVQAAFETALSAGRHLYSPFAGFPSLLERIAEKLASVNGVDVGPDRIFCTPGGAGALFVSIMATTDPGDELLVQDPCWEHFHQIARLAGVTTRQFRMVAVDGGRYTPDLEHLRAQITSRTRAILINTPLNPCGSVLTREEIEDLLDVARTHGLRVICDEEYEAFAYGGRRHVSPASIDPDVITLQSFSKTFALTGVRLGYVTGPPAVVDGVRKVALYSYMASPSPSQHVAEAVLSGDYRTYMEGVRQQYERHAQRATEALASIDGVDCFLPEGGLYVVPSFAAFGLDGHEAAESLFTDAHLLGVPGEVAGEQMRGRVRLFHGLRPEVLELGLSRIAELAARWAARSAPEELSVAEGSR